MIVIQTYSAHECYLELVSLHSLLKARYYDRVKVDLPVKELNKLREVLKENEKFDYKRGTVYIL